MKKAENWRKYYNENRPHSSLGNLTPKEFAQKLAFLPLAEPSDRLARGVESLENWSPKLEYVEGKVCVSENRIILKKNSRFF